MPAGRDIVKQRKIRLVFRPLLEPDPQLSVSAGDEPDMHHPVQRAGGVRLFSGDDPNRFKRIIEYIKVFHKRFLQTTGC